MKFSLHSLRCKPEEMAEANSYNRDVIGHMQYTVAKDDIAINARRFFSRITIEFFSVVNVDCHCFPQASTSSSFTSFSVVVHRECTTMSICREFKDEL